MYNGHTVLEDYYYVFKTNLNQPQLPGKIRFTGRKISEFKNEIYRLNLYG